jgi:hypothetical protein
MASWKRLLLKAAGFGAGSVLVVSLIVLTWVSWSNRERPWKKSVITTSFTVITAQVRDESVYLTFKYGLHNTGKEDYSFPSTATGQLFVKLPEGRGLERLEDSKWPLGVIIPPNQTVNIEFDVPFKLSKFNSTSEELRSLPALGNFVNRRLKAMDGFTFFDYTNRYQIELANGWPNTPVE